MPKHFQHQTESFPYLRPRGEPVHVCLCTRAPPRQKVPYQWQVTTWPAAFGIEIFKVGTACLIEHFAIESWHGHERVSVISQGSMCNNARSI